MGAFSAHRRRAIAAKALIVMHFYVFGLGVELGLTTVPPMGTAELATDKEGYDILFGPLGAAMLSRRAPAPPPEGGADSAGLRTIGRGLLRSSLCQACAFQGGCAVPEGSAGSTVDKSTTELASPTGTIPWGLFGGGPRCAGDAL